MIKRLLRALRLFALVVLVAAVLLAVSLIPWTPLGSVLMLIAAAGLIPSPLAYQWRSKGVWRRHPLGWHLMAYMGVFAAVMVLAVVNTLRNGLVPPPSDLPLFVRALVWECVGIVAWWRLVVILRTPKD